MTAPATPAVPARLVADALRWTEDAPAINFVGDHRERMGAIRSAAQRANDDRLAACWVTAWWLLERHRPQLTRAEVTDLGQVVDAARRAFFDRRPAGDPLLGDWARRRRTAVKVRQQLVDAGWEPLDAWLEASHAERLFRFA